MCPGFHGCFELGCFLHSAFSFTMCLWYLLHLRLSLLSLLLRYCPIIIIRSDFKSDSCLSGVMWVSRPSYGGRTEFWWCQITWVFVAYVLVLSSCHLVIAGATCTHCLWPEPVPPDILVVSDLLRVQLSLWSCDPEILGVTAPESQAASGIQKSWFDQALEIQWSYDPMILGTLEHLGVQLSLGVVGLGRELELKVC